MKKQLLSIMLICIAFASNSQLYTPGSGVTDIDGNTYQTVVINGQEWMAENLRTTKYANGDPIPNVTDDTQWSNLATGAWAHYNNDSQYENPYGKLYNWHTVADPRNVCPTGWHVPTDSEYTLLTDYLGGESVAGGKMKSTGTQYWQSPNQDATNESGFLGLPSGKRGVVLEGIDWTFSSISLYGCWWSSSENGTGSAMYRRLEYDYGVVYSFGTDISNGFSVRCIKINSSGLNESKPNSKTVIKVFDLLGNETVINPNSLQFYLYNDGSIEKKIIIEK